MHAQQWEKLACDQQIRESQVGGMVEGDWGGLNASTGIAR